MKRLLFTLSVFSLSLMVFAQEGVVQINNHAGVVTESPRLEQTVKGYSVRIFFDNSQDARNGSAQAKAKFSQIYPDTYVHDEYNAPYFKVTAGNFLTHEEAIILWGNILNVFPTAFVVGNNIPYREFVNSKTLAPQASTSSVVEEEAVGEAAFETE